MRPPLPLRRLAGAVTLALVASVSVSGCEFDGAYDLPLPRAVDEDESYQLTAEFADVLAVVPRSTVMVDDVPVGEVTEVDRVGWHAQVTMRIRDDVVLPDNARAEIRQSSLLGEKYVALAEPTTEKPAGRLADGDRIPLSATGRNPEIEEVLGALSFLLSGGGVAQLGVITRELNAVMSGREDRLRMLLTDLEEVVGTVDGQKTQIIAAMTSLNNLARTLNRQKQTIGDALEELAPAVDVLAAQHQELVRMLKALDRLGVVGARVIRASKADLLAVLRDLRPVLEKLNETGDSLVPGLGLALSFPFPKEASTVVKGDYANTVIRMDISLENVELGGPGQPPGLPELPELPELPLPELPDLPLPELPLPEIPGVPLPDLPLIPGLRTGARTTTSAARCAAAGDLLGGACSDSLATTAGFQVLVVTCRAPSYATSGVCRSINALPVRGDLLGDLPDLPGLAPALRDGAATPTPSPEALYGGDAS